MGKIGTQAKTYSNIVNTTGTQNTAIGKPTNCSGYYKTAGTYNTAVGQKKPPLKFMRGLHIIRVMSGSTTIDNELP